MDKVELMGCGADGARVEARGLQVVRNTRECLLGIRFTGKGGAAQLLERFDFSVPVLAALLVNRALRLWLAMLRVDEDPPVCHTTIPRSHDGIPIALWQRDHGLRLCLGQDLFGLRHSRRDTGDPLHLGLGKLLEVVGAIESTVGYQRGRALGGLEGRKVVPDDLAALTGITALATERLHQDREPSLVLHNQLQHHLVQVGPMSPTLAVGDVHDLVGGRGRAGIPAIDMDAGTIEMRAGRGQAQAFGGRSDNEAVECGHAIGVERIQGPSERVIVELARLNARGDEARAACAEKMGDEVALLVDEAQAMKDQGFDRMAHGHQTQFRVLLGSLIKDPR